MNKRYCIVFAFVVLTNALHAQEAIPAPEQGVIDAQTTADSAIQLQPKPRPRPSIVGSFSRFVRIFLAILSNNQIQNNAKLMEKLFTSLMQTAYQIIQTTTPIAAQSKRSAYEQDNYDLIAELAQHVVKESKALTIDRQPRPHNGMDDDTKAIVANFAGVVENFFRIIADPENKETVPAGIIGMLAGMVNIGTIVVTKSGAPLDADYEQLKIYAEQLDPEIKKHMYRIILSARDRSGLSIS